MAHDRACSYILCSTVMIIGALDFGVVLPSLIDYVTSMHGSEQFYGLVIASFMFSRMLFQVIFSSLTDRFGFKRVYLVTLTVQFSGELCFAFAGNKWMIILGRMICGCGSANGDLGYAYMGRTLAQGDVSSEQLKLTASRSIGTVLGPAASVFLQHIDVLLPGGLRITYMNSPALVVAAMDVLALLGMVFFFKDIDSGSQHQSGVDVKQYAELPGEPATRSEASRCATLLKPGVVFVNLLVCISALNLGLLEAIMAPVGERFFAWVPATTSLCFAVLAFTVMFLNFSISHANKKCHLSDRALIAAGAAISMVGGVLVVLWWSGRGVQAGFTEFKFVLSLFIFSACQPSFMIGSLRALYTKLIPQSMQGALQGACSFVYSFGNLVGPNLSTSALAMGIGPLKWLMFVTVSANILLLALGWRFLAPRVADAKAVSLPFISPGGFGSPGLE